MIVGFDLSSDDPVTAGLRASARRLVGVAAFSGIVNLLTLSGSLYMLQVYDRVIPSRNLATLVGLSLIVLFAYVLQGYFDALRTRMLARIGTLFDAGLQKPIYHALAILPLKGARPFLAQQPLRDLDQVRTFLSGIGPTAFLDMPWIPIFLIALYIFHPAIGVAATLGAAAIIVVTLVTERRARGPARAAMETSAHRQVLADATRQNADVIRALGMTDRFTERWLRGNDRFLEINIRTMDTHANLGSGAKVLRYILQSSMLGIGAYLVVIEQASGGIMIASSIMMGRALAPIEVALSTWKQLVAARQGIIRRRNRKVRRSPFRVRVRDWRSAISRCSLQAPIGRSCQKFRSRSKPGWAWRCLDRALRESRRSRAPWLEYGLRRTVSYDSTAPLSISGIAMIWAGTSDTCRRTLRCSTVPSRTTSRALTLRHPRTPSSRPRRSQARTR